jgi:hypothetical protein
MTKIFLHLFFQSASGPVELYFYRIGIQPQDLTYFFQRLLPFIEQGDQLAVIRAQQADRVVYHGMPGFLLNGIRFKRGFTVFQLRKDPVVIDGGDIQFLFPQESQTTGPRDGIKPGAEFRFPPEIGEGAVGFYKYILADFFRIFPAIGKTQDQGEHILLIPFDQLRKESLLSMQDLANDLFISESGIHHGNKTPTGVGRLQEIDEFLTECNIINPNVGVTSDGRGGS